MLKLPWLSMALVILANVAFSAWLVQQGYVAEGWYGAISYTAFQAALISIGWRPARKLFLLGFTSDVGYSIMALLGASLAVVIVVWIQTVSYFLVMLAAALLLRVELLTRDIGNVLSFVAITLLSWAGLGLGWVILSSMAEIPVMQGLGLL
ncbi:MAG: hypothetical protein AAFU71_16535 [Cyanobacteria bacterium J06632_22]